MKRILRVPLMLLGLTGLAACDPPLGSQNNPVGTATLLAYAAPGTEIEIENTINGDVSRSVITAATPVGARGAYLDQDGTPGDYYPGCWDCGGDSVIDEEAYRKLWPLAIGNRAVFTRTRPNGETARVVIAVTESGQITTPAGTFDTWILQGRVEHLTGPAYSAQIRAWWAPGPGWVVRARGGDSAGNAFATEVVRFVFPQL